ncbi:hypothetical protein TNCV_2770161 [Trichonephila clavipes]|nr:hypothetical protein TNCV_2770161 [Trichonephila clavipes]
MPRTRQSDPLMTQTASEKFNLIDLIPMYDGGESLGIRRFLEKINDVANLGKWSNDEKVTILKLKLAGIAEEFFLSDPTHSQLTEYNDIARILIGRFEKAVPLSTRLQLFSSCIQGPSESVQEFAARINKLGTLIFQSGNSAQNTAVRNANDQLLQSRDGRSPVPKDCNCNFYICPVVVYKERNFLGASLTPPKRVTCSHAWKKALHS